jgi:hypothetical protein
MEWFLNSKKRKKEKKTLGPSTKARPTFVRPWPARQAHLGLTEPDRPQRPWPPWLRPAAAAPGRACLRLLGVRAYLRSRARALRSSLLPCTNRASLPRRLRRAEHRRRRCHLRFAASVDLQGERAPPGAARHQAASKEPLPVAGDAMEHRAPEETMLPAMSVRCRPDSGRLPPSPPLASTSSRSLRSPLSVLLLTRVPRRPERRRFGCLELLCAQPWFWIEPDQRKKKIVLHLSP